MSDFLPIQVFISTCDTGYEAESKKDACNFENCLEHDLTFKYSLDGHGQKKKLFDKTKTLI